MSQPPQLPDFSAGQTSDHQPQRAGREPRPGTSADPRPHQGQDSNKLVIGVVLGGIALIVVVALVLGLTLFRSALDEPAPTAAPSQPQPSSPGAPAPEPTDFPEPEDSTPPPPAPSPTSDQPTKECPSANPYATGDYPRDGRMHGGNMSVPIQKTGPDGNPWQMPAPDGRFSFANDVQAQHLQVHSDDQGTWNADIVLGELEKDEDFKDAKSAAERIMQCSVTSDLYVPFDSQGKPTRTDLEAKQISVDGHEAWRLSAEIAVERDMPFPGDTVALVVVETDEDSLGFFFGARPTGQEQWESFLPDLVAQIDVE